MPTRILTVKTCFENKLYSVENWGARDSGIKGEMEISKI